MSLVVGWYPLSSPISGLEISWWGGGSHIRAVVASAPHHEIELAEQTLADMVGPGPSCPGSVAPLFALFCEKAGCIVYFLA